MVTMRCGCDLLCCNDAAVPPSIVAMIVASSHFFTDLCPVDKSLCSLDTKSTYFGISTKFKYTPLDLDRGDRQSHTLMDILSFIHFVWLSKQFQE